MPPHADAPVSAGIEPSVAIATDRRPDAAGARIRVGIIGATGYVGSELIRLLSRHPDVEVVGLQGRDRHEAVGVSHPHLSGTGLTVESDLPDVDAVFLALPHGTAAGLVPEIVGRGTAVIDLGPDFRLRSAADYPRWYGFEHPRADLLDAAVYGLPELHRAEIAALRDGADGDRRLAGLLSDGDPAGARAPRPRRADRRSRRRRQERRLRRRPRREGPT